MASQSLSTNEQTMFSSIIFTLNSRANIKCNLTANGIKLVSEIDISAKVDGDKLLVTSQEKSDNVIELPKGGSFTNNHVSLKNISNSFVNAGGTFHCGGNMDFGNGGSDESGSSLVLLGGDFHVDGAVTMNGRKIDVNKKQAGYERQWTIPFKGKITSVVQNGEGFITFHNDIFDKNLTITISGGGSMKLCSDLYFEKLVVKAIGHGRIHCGQAMVNEINASINGKGHIIEFTAICSGSFSIADAGSISGMAGKQCKVTEDIKKTGKVTIRICE